MNDYIKELKILRTEITSLRNVISSMKKSNSAQFTVEYETDEDGNIKFDEDGNPVIKQSTVGKFSKLIIDEFKKYLESSFTIGSDGKIIVDTDKLGKFTKYIYNEFDDVKVLFNIGEESSEGETISNDGEVIAFIKTKFKEIDDKLLTLIETSNNISISLGNLHTKIDDMKAVVDTINNNTKPSE